MKKILVVEDDAVSARMLRDYLDAHGYATSIAGTGPDGVKLFNEQSPDLMIVDVALPLKNGFEVCFEVKRTEYGRTMPVLMMSAVMRDELYAKKYAREDLHAEDWLLKPFELENLLVQVEKLIGRA
jgi:DNA-binding response OmpR family regulator